MGAMVGTKSDGDSPEKRAKLERLRAKMKKYNEALETFQLAVDGTLSF